ncbi:hypothetical protein STSP2_00451 [Anaerohalosphaera lusitana]|uniref:Uncharacterized protein n=2 Tax=Anaerohalosphaera lusitana TaxID=1936003 RepID=A0A1U9NHS6_9BACT|nr:hypothetical protein STSP2_00451 [Anaerohalosphaera lusitana]
MKICKAVLLSMLLCVVLVNVTGCSNLGETRAEASRRYERILRINTNQIGHDLDLIFMMDKPSTLTPMLVR